MRKRISLHKNYTLNEEGYQLKLPLNLETIIPVDDSVRLLSQFVEAMDLTDLYSTYERINTVSPRTLLKIVLYSYMNGDYSSRSMELNCKRDINFMYLLEGKSVPDHATFARFRSIHFAHVPNVSLLKCQIFFMNSEKFQDKRFLLMVQKSKLLPINKHLCGKKPLPKIRKNC